jgi:hypothetical protein
VFADLQQPAVVLRRRRAIAGLRRGAGGPGQGAIAVGLLLQGRLELPQRRSAWAEENPPSSVQLACHPLDADGVANWGTLGLTGGAPYPTISFTNPGGV